MTDTVHLPPPPALGAPDDALTHRCVRAGAPPRPATLGQLSALLGHACAPGPLELRPGRAPAPRHGGGLPARLTARGNAPIPRGSYAYQPVRHTLDRRAPHEPTPPSRDAWLAPCPDAYGTGHAPHPAAYDAPLVLHLPPDDPWSPARAQAVAAAVGLCAHGHPDDAATLLLHATAAPRPPAGPGADLADALAAVPDEPPHHTSATVGAHDLGALLQAAALTRPYWVSVRGVDGLDPGVYRTDAADGALRPVWRGHTAPLAHVLTRGGHAAAAALAMAPATVHLARAAGVSPRDADRPRNSDWRGEALRLAVAAHAAGLTAWCDDAPAAAAAAFLGTAGGEGDVLCHVTLGRAEPEPRIRIVPPALPDALAPVGLPSGEGATP